MALCLVTCCACSPQPFPRDVSPPPRKSLGWVALTMSAKNIGLWRDIPSDSSGRESDGSAAPSEGSVETPADGLAAVEGLVVRPTRVSFGDAEVQSFDVAGAGDWRPVTTRAAGAPAVGARVRGGPTERGFSVPGENVRFGIVSLPCP
eukprot:3427208-Alexandrium_andersonii.AAC.1